MDDDLSQRLIRAAGVLPLLDEETFNRVNRPAHHRTSTPLLWLVACGLVAGGVWILLAPGTAVQLTQTPGTSSIAGAPAATAPDSVATTPTVGTSATPEGQPTSPRAVSESASPSSAPSDVVEGNQQWEVLSVGRTNVAWPSGIIASAQSEMDEAWTLFEMEAAAPSLPARRGAIFLSVAGECADASAALGVEYVHAFKPSGPFAVINMDPSCAVIDRFGTNEPGQRTLYVISVPSERSDILVGAQATSAAVTGLEWQLLAVSIDPSGEFFGAGRLDQDGIDWAWSNWGLTGAVPQLADGWQGWMEPGPITCNEASSLLSVEAMGEVYDDGLATVVLTMHLSSACAPVDLQVRASSPQSVYAIAVHNAVGDTLHGPRAFISCAPEENVGPCASVEPGHVPVPEGRRLVPLRPW